MFNTIWFFRNKCRLKTYYFSFLY